MAVLRTEGRNRTDLALLCPAGTAFAGWCLYTWGALLVHLRKSLTTRKMLWLIGIFLLAWLLFVADPGRRFEWWLD